MVGRIPLEDDIGVRVPGRQQAQFFINAFIKNYARLLAMPGTRKTEAVYGFAKQNCR